jgi:hypothetical protein
VLIRPAPGGTPLRAPIPDRVLVEFLIDAGTADDEREGQRAARIALARQSLLDGLDPAQTRVARVFAALPLVVLEVSPAMRRALEASQRVLWLYADDGREYARECGEPAREEE